MPLHTLKKDERLKSRKHIALLFEKGRTIKNYPLMVRWMKLSDITSPGGVLFGVTVPKRNHARAVTRNKLKRTIREAYRINCIELRQIAEKKEAVYGLMFIFIGDDAKSTREIHEKMSEILSRICSRI